MANARTIRNGRSVSPDSIASTASSVASMAESTSAKLWRNIGICQPVSSSALRIKT